MLRFRPPRLRMSLSSVPTTERHRRQRGLAGHGDKGVVHLHRVFRLYDSGPSGLQFVRVRRRFLCVPRRKATL